GHDRTIFVVVPKGGDFPRCWPSRHRAATPPGRKKSGFWAPAPPHPRCAGGPGAVPRGGALELALEGLMHPPPPPRSMARDVPWPRRRARRRASPRWMRLSIHRAAWPFAVLDSRVQTAPPTLLRRVDLAPRFPP